MCRRVTTKKMWLPNRHTHTWSDRQMLDKVIPMCHYASQATQKPMYSLPRNVCPSETIFRIDTSTTFCPLITQTLRIISVRCIPLSLRSKTRRRATLLLPTWICSCQSVGTVNFALPFTTNVTISISILQTFRSWVATSHLRPPMAFLSHNSSDTPGLAPLMNVLFWGRCDFQISFSGRDMSRNVWNRL